MKTHGTGGWNQVTRLGGAARLRTLAAVVAVVGLLPAVASAQNSDGTWTTTAAGTYNWSSVSNWNFGSGPIADGANHTANFTAGVSGTNVVTVDTSRTIGNLVFDNANPGNIFGWQISGPSTNTLTLSNSAAGGPTVTVGASTGNALTATITANLAGTQGFTFSGNGAANAAINGSSILFLQGNNTGLSGGITVNNAGILQVAGTSTVNPLGSNQVKLAGGTLRLGGATVVALDPSSFNQSMVLPGPAASTPFSGNISATMTGGIGLTGGTFFLKGTNANGNAGLPMGTTIASLANPSIRYALQPAAVGAGVNNALFFAPAGSVEGGPNGLTTGTMLLSNPVALSTIALLGVTGNGNATTVTANPSITVTINYADGTPSFTVATPIQFPDFASTATGFAYNALGQVNAGTPPVYQILSTKPKLWDKIITNPNQNDPISSLSLSWATGTQNPTTNTTAIFSIGGAQSAVAQNFAGNNVLVTADSTIDVGSSAAVTIGNISVGSNMLSITSGPLASGGFAMTGNPNLNIGIGATLTPSGPFSDGGTARTLTLSGPGTLVAGVASPSLSAGTGVVVNAGTVNVNSGTAFGPSPNVSLSNVGSVVNLGPSSNPTFGSLASTAAGGVLVLNGNALTINGSATTTYSGAIQDGSAAGSLIKSGSGTQTLSGANTFTGGITVSGGILVGTSGGSLSTGTITLAGGNLKVGGGGGGPPVNITGFGGLGTGWTTNTGNASGAGVAPAGTATFTAADTLQLTPAAGNALGSAWYNTPVPIRPFTLSFTYTVPTGTAPPADGMTVGFQNAGLNALGGSNGGSSLAYNTIPTSVAEEINIFPTNTNGGAGSGIGLLTNGQNPAGFPAIATAPVNAGLLATPTNVVLTWDGANMVIKLTQGASVYTSAPQPVDILSNVGGSTAFFGFTGATGGSDAQQVITNLVFNSPAQNTYANNVVVTAPAATISVLASAAVPVVNMGSLSLASGGTLTIQADSSVPSGQTFGMTFTGTTLNGSDTIAMPANGTGGAGTLVLGPITNGTGTGALAITGGPAVTIGAGSFGGRLNLGTSNLTMLGNLTVGSLVSSSAVTVSNGTTGLVTLTVGGDNTSTTAIASIIDGSGPVALVKTGFGTLTLSGTNSYSGGTTILDGTLAVSTDPGTGSLTIGSSTATLLYTSSVTTTRSIALGGGTLAAGAGALVTLNGGTFTSGLLGGSGIFLTSGANGATVANVTIRPATTFYSNSSVDRFINDTNGGTLNVGVADAHNPAGNINMPTPVTFVGLTSQGSGSMTVGQNISVNVQDFQSYGTLTLNSGTFNGSSGGFTQFINTGSSKLFFNGGSRTFISTAAQAANINAGIDLHGSDAEVAGGLFVNNGYVIDSTSGGHRVVADFGAVVKGAGFYQTIPQTINGGTFITGNSPGLATTGAVVIGGTGLSSYTWQINDAGPSNTYPSAPGISGPTQNAAGQVSGWGRLAGVALTFPVVTTGNMEWDATTASQFTIHMQTLLAPNDASGNPAVGGGYETSGDSTAGLMSDFDPTKSYTWKIFNYAGTYTGPTDTATLDASTIFDAAGFLNPHAGRFDWVLNQASQEMDLVFTPTAVPEPGTLSLLGATGLLAVWRLRRKKVAKAAAVALAVCCLFPAASHAQSGTWTQNVYTTSSYNWGDITNWNNGSGPVASGANNTATFAVSNNTSGDIAINMDTARTIGAMVFDNPTTTTGYFISGANALTLSNSGAGGPTIAVNNPNMNVGIIAPIAGTQGYTKTGVGTLYVNGDSSGLTGGISVSAGTLAATQYSTGNNPLGGNTINLSGGTLQFGAAVPVPTVISTLTPSSFNQKMVVGVGTTFANSGITATMDGGTALSGNTWYQYGQNATDVANTNGPGGTNLRSGLPMGTTLTSVANPTFNYQMQSTSVNNALLLDATHLTGTMTFTIPVTQPQLSFLSSTGNGGTASTITVTFHYTDGTADATNTFAALDWFGNSPIAVGTSGRIASGTGVGTYNNITSPPTTTSNPCLYDMIVSNPNPGDPIGSVTLTTNAAGTQHTAVMSIGGTFVPLPGSTTSPGTIGAQNFAGNNILVTANSTISVAATTTVGGLSIGSNTLTVTGAASLTTGGVTLTGNPTFSVTNGVTLNTGALSDGGTARTITVSGAGAMTVPAAASLVAATNLVVNGGTVTFNSPTSFGASPGVTVNIGGGVSLAAAIGPTAFTSLNGTGGAVTLNGNILTLGSASGTATYNGSIAGGTPTTGSLVKTGASTQTLAGFSTFSGGTTVSAGKLVVGAPGSLGTGPVTLSGGTLSIGAAAPGGFGGTGTGWATNGTANFPSTGVLQLTANTGNQAGSAWFGTKVPVGPFTASFTYTVPAASAQPADGMTFGFQNQGLTALGAAGGSLGYAGITPSAAVQLNIYPPNTTGGVGSGVGFITNGATPGAVAASAPVNAGLVNTPDNFTVTYDGTTLTVTQTQGTNTFTSTFTGSISSIAGATAYMGFTGGTGGSQAQQQISNFVFNPSTPINYSYSNSIIATTTSSTILVAANPAASSFAMTGGLTLQQPGSTINIQADPSTPSGQAYGLGFGPLTLNGTTTFNVLNNGAGGTATLTLGTISNGSGTGSLVMTGGANLVLAGGGSILGQLNLGSSNLSIGANLTVGSLASTAGVTINSSSTSLVTLTVGGDNTSTTATANFANGAGPLALVKTGLGTLTLAGSDTTTGGTSVLNGTLAVSADPGTGPIVVSPTATLQYNGTPTTTQSFALNGGTVAAGTNAKVTLNGSVFSAGGYISGPGLFLTSGANGARFVDTTIRTSATIYSNSSLDQFSNVGNGGALNVGVVNATNNPAGNINITTPVNFNAVTNQGGGSITVGQNITVDVQDFQSYGTLTLNSGTFNGSSGGFTQFINTGSSKLFFNGGSRTFISTAAQAANINAGIDLHGSDAEVAGGLFVNNGYVIDSTSGGHRVVADFGAVVKGAGFYQTIPQTINGGTFITGNSPGLATTGAVVIGGTGLSSYTWQINDAGPSNTYPSAPGISGPTQNAAGQVSGWGRLAGVALTFPVVTTGNMEWDATTASQFTIHMQTLLAPNDASGNPAVGGGYETSGDSTAGLMSDFDPTKSYTWKIFNYAGTYTGPTDTATLDASTIFDAAGFLNPHAGRFDWVLNQASQEMDLVFTPTAVPEPGTLSLLGATGLLAVWRLRRKKVAKAAAVALAVCCLFPAASHAQSGTWTQASNGLIWNWGDITNWNNGSGPIANGANNTATFAPAGITSGIIVNLDSPRTIGNLVFDNPSGSAGWTLQGTNTLTLSNTGGPSITVNNTGGTATAPVTATIKTTLAGAGFNKMGAGNLLLYGNNTGLTSGITVSAGVLGVTTNGSTNPLGSNAVTLAGGTLRLGDGTGDNQKMIVPTGSTFANAGITATMDGGTSKVNYTWYQLGQNTAASATGLPMGTTITSAAGNGIQYALPTVSNGVNDSLMLDLQHTAGRLVLATPTSGLSTISFLTSSGNVGIAAGSIPPTITATIHYSDGTPDATGLTFTSPDWFTTTTSGVPGTPAYQAGGRVSSAGYPTDVVNPPTPTSYPNLFDEMISNPNPGSAVNSIDLSWAVGTGGTQTTIHTTVLALGTTGAAIPIAGPNGAQNFTNGVNVTANSTIDIETSAGAAVGNLSIGSNTLSVTSSGLLATPTLTVGAINMTGNPTLNVAAGVPVTTNSPLTDGGTVRNFTKNGNGNLTVGAASPTLQAGTGVTVNGGNLNLNNATAFGASPAVSINGGNVNLLAGTNPTFGSLSGFSSGTLTLNANTLTIGSSSGSFAGSIVAGTGTGSVIKAGAGTQTLTGTSTYTGGTTITGGTLVAVPGSMGTGAVTLAGGTLAVGPSQVSNGFNGATGTGANGGWTTNGGATFPSANVLQITPTTSSAWMNTPVNISVPFVIKFTITNLLNAAAADGFTVGFQNDPRGTAAIGGGGGQIGYSGGAGVQISPSAVMQLNLYANNTIGGVGSGVAMLTNGNMANPVPATAPVNFGAFNSPTQVTLTYDGTNADAKFVQGTSTFDSGAMPIDIVGTVGSSALFGFTGSTGSVSSQVQISNFSYSSTAFSTTTNPVQGTYAVPVIVSSNSTLQVTASAAFPTVAMTTLNMGTGTTLSVVPDPANPAGQAFGVTFTGTTLNGPATFNVSAGAAGNGTLNLGPLTNVGTTSITLNGGGTLVLGSSTAVAGGLTINAGTVSLNGNSISFGSLAGSGGTTINDNAAANATLTVGSNNSSGTFGGLIADGSTGKLALVKIGTGTLSLTGSNTYSGGTTVSDGTLSIANDASLGTGAVTIGSTATLNYTSSTTTNRSFAVNGGTVSAGSGINVTLNGGTFAGGGAAGGYLSGAGRFFTGTATGARIAGATIEPSTTVYSNSSLDQFINDTNGGTLNVGVADAHNPAGNINIPTPATFSGVTNQGSGSITVGQNITVDVQDFQSYGALTLNSGTFNGSSGGFTQFINTGSSKLFFNGGSRTFISTAAQAANINAGIDLHGSDAEVAGGLFVNNGYVIDSTSGGHRVVADFGAVVKGAGFYQTIPQTINGGTFITGNSPGLATTGAVVIGGTGLSSYTWQINDAGPSNTYPSAPGISGPTQNAAGQVSGWGRLAGVALTFPVVTTGNMEWDATTASQFTIHMQTLLAPNDASGNPAVGGGYETSGDSTAGLMSDFDPTKSYTWKIFNYAGTYTGPTDTATLDASTIFDAAGFLNPHAGRFDWVLNQASQEMDLVFTPTAVPEPGTLSLLGLAGLGLAAAVRRRKARKAAAA